MNDHQAFEIAARRIFKKKFGRALPPRKVFIQGKEKGFDLVSKNEKIVGDCKHYRNTKSGNIPSAKRSILNEYVWILQKLSKDVRKFLVIGEDYKMAERYVRDFCPWLEGVQVYFYKRGQMPILLTRK